jgi:hypothetical protein
MTIFIELSTSPIEQQFKTAAQNLLGTDTTSARRAGAESARRPARGIEIKDDTYATLKVIRSDGTPIPLVDSGSANGQNTDGYTNFMLQSVQEDRMEKHQIIETFGASYVFFFGEQPRFLNISAVLLNTLDFNWEAEWWSNYNTYLRGTKLVEMGARCYLSYDDSIVEGYLMNATCAKTADAPYHVQLQFRFFVTNCYNVSNIGNENYPLRYTALVPDNVNLRQGDAGEQLVSTLQGGPLMNAFGYGLKEASRLSNTLISNNKLGASRSISQLVRNMPPSFAVPPEYYPLLESRADIRSLAYRSGKPIRGKFSDNTDEYIGAVYDSLQGPNYVGQATIRSTQNTQDLFWQATAELYRRGANINNPSTHRALGICPNFGNTNGAGATFSTVATAGFGFSANVGVGLQAVAGGAVNTRANTDGFSASAFSASSFTASARADSLGVIYGRTSSKTVKFSSKTQRLVETGFDYSYGYESTYAVGAGFGKAGFGDYGGNGFGSCNRFGDPGFERPDNFSFEGVVDAEASFTRFTRVRTDRTALTRGQMVGRGELSGGAFVEVKGNISAFALISVEGTLNPKGDTEGFYYYGELSA